MAERLRNGCLFAGRISRDSSNRANTRVSPPLSPRAIFLNFVSGTMHVYVFILAWIRLRVARPQILRYYSSFVLRVLINDVYLISHGWRHVWFVSITRRLHPARSIRFLSIDVHLLLIEGDYKFADTIGFDINKGRKTVRKNWYAGTKCRIANEITNFAVRFTRARLR